MNLPRSLTNWQAPPAQNSTYNCPLIKSLQISARMGGRNPTCAGKSGPPPLPSLRSFDRETSCVAISKFSLATAFKANPTCLSPLRVMRTFRMCIVVLRHNTSVPDSKALGASFSCPWRTMGFWFNLISNRLMPLVSLLLLLIMP